MLPVNDADGLVHGDPAGALLGHAVPSVLTRHVALSEVATGEVEVSRIERHKLREHHVLHLCVLVLEVVPVHEAASLRRVPVEVDVERDAALVRGNLEEFRVAEVRRPREVEIDVDAFVVLLGTLVPEVLGVALVRVLAFPARRDVIARPEVVGLVRERQFVAGVHGVVLW